MSNLLEKRKKVIQDYVDWLEVLRLSIWWDLLISLLFWRISIRYRAFVEGSLCPPKHFPNTRVSAPFLPPFSSLVCQITFPTQPQYPRQQPLLWAYTIARVWSLWCMLCQYSWEERCEGEMGGGGRKLFISYGSTRRETQALINYVVHLHIPVVRHYVNTKRSA